MTNAINESDYGAVEQAISRRILLQHVDWVNEYGLDQVLATISDVAQATGDVDEIGSSDVSYWVSQVERQLKLQVESINLEENTPPGMENWIMQNKSQFKKRYSETNWEQALYATAWKIYNQRNRTQAQE